MRRMSEAGEGALHLLQACGGSPHPTRRRCAMPGHLLPACGEKEGAYGRSILQVVGSMVSGGSILAASFQPQPVFSSSNGSLSERSPNDAMYIGWKNWWSSLRMVPLPPS